MTHVYHCSQTTVYKFAQLLGYLSTLFSALLIANFILIIDTSYTQIFKYLYIPTQFCHEKHTANIQTKKKLVNMVRFH